MADSTIYAMIEGRGERGFYKKIFQNDVVIMVRAIPTVMAISTGWGRSAFGSFRQRNAETRKMIPMAGANIMDDTSSNQTGRSAMSKKVTGMANVMTLNMVTKTLGVIFSLASGQIVNVHSLKA
jgi:hypothetical protein